MQEHLCSHREGQFHFPTACTLSLILMTSLSSLPQLLAILDNLVEVSNLTDEERLWVYDKFASRTGKGPTRKEAVAPAMNAFTFLMRKNPRPILTTALPLSPVKKAKVSRSGKNEKAVVLLINNLREASRLRHNGQIRMGSQRPCHFILPGSHHRDKTLSATLHRHRKGCSEGVVHWGRSSRLRQHFGFYKAA